MRKEIIGDATLYLGDCLSVIADLEPVTHIICDPPYESSLHEAAKNGSKLRKDNGPELKAIDFDGIDTIREDFVRLSYPICEGWFLAFCMIEGVRPWADCINASPMKYKQSCLWVKPDATPQMNGQGPAKGAEAFVAAWCGKGHSKWNGGGKRGVYTHLVNGQDRHGDHPTEKSLSLFKELIADFTNPNETILDPFMGSGTTGVAAIMGGRKFIGIEQNEHYFDIACERIHAASQYIPIFTETISNKARKKQEAADAERLSIPLFGDSE